MSNEAFYNILKRYLAGKSTDEEKKIVERWYSVLDDVDLAEINDTELSGIGEKMRSNLLQQVAPARNAPKRRPLPAVALFLVAASVLGILFSIVFLVNVPQEKPAFALEENVPPVESRKNGGNEPFTFLLEDGSSVTLQPGAEITYPAAFNRRRREVSLTGNAFFEVVKISGRPFYVYSEDLITEVSEGDVAQQPREKETQEGTRSMLSVKKVAVKRGTAFIYKEVAIDPDRAEAPAVPALGASFVVRSGEVAVLSGNVVVRRNETRRRLYQRLMDDEVALKTNQRAVYHDDTRELVVTLVEQPVPVKSEEGTEQAAMHFVFSETPVAEVFAALEKAYDVTIDAGEQNIRQCFFTGDLTDTDLFAQLTLVCRSTGAAFEVDGTIIRIKGGNCHP